MVSWLIHCKVFTCAVQRRYRNKWKWFVIVSYEKDNIRTYLQWSIKHCDLSHLGLRPMDLPGCVGQSEAAPLEVDAAVHQQLSEEQRGVSRRPTRGIPGRDLWGSSGGARFGPGHELNDGQPGPPWFLWPLLNFCLLFIRALRAQLTHGEQRMVRGQVVSPFVCSTFGNFDPRYSFSLVF